MPYYKWSGINLYGELCHGKSFASTQDELSRVLINRDIGIMQARELSLRWRHAAISTALKVKTIAHLAFLLKSEIHLYHALSIVAATIRHDYFRNVIEDVAHHLTRGKSLSTAFGLHSTVFDELTRALAKVGEETGHLAYTLQLHVDHAQKMEEFKRSVKRALLVPIVTASFFCLLVVAIFIFIIPKFALFFETFQQPLPASTLVIIKISEYFTSGFIFLALLGASCAWYFFYYYFMKKRGRTILAYLLFVPCIAEPLKDFYRAQFLHIIGLLLCGGVHITNALLIASSSFSNIVLIRAIQEIAQDVASGKTLSASLSKHTIFSSHELSAIITIGESSGELAVMIKHASELYQQNVYDRLTLFAQVIQPALLVILGILIASLIVAIYLPVFTLTTALS